MSTDAAPRVGRRLVDCEDWTTLIEGEVDAIQLVAFANLQECEEMLHFVAVHPRTCRYGTAAGIVRLGTSLSDVRKSGTFDEYITRDVLCDALALNGVVARLMGQIVCSWPLGLETLTHNGVVLHRAIGRRIHNSGAEPHDDNIAKELPDHATARDVTLQIGVNLYLEMPARGGELEGWRRTLTVSEYETLRSDEPGHTYGVRRHAIGAADWRLVPAVGDVVIFRNSELHAIRASDGYRSTWGFFLGYRGPDRQLLIWS